MQELPEIIGLTLDDALEICETEGYVTEIIFTRPVKAQPAGCPRVVKFDKVSKNKGVLTVVFEDKGRGGG